MKDKQLTVRMKTGRSVTGEQAARNETGWTGKRAVGMTTVERDAGSKICSGRPEGQTVVRMIASRTGEQEVVNND
jgi:hypothetical protein